MRKLEQQKLRNFLNHQIQQKAAINKKEVDDDTKIGKKEITTMAQRMAQAEREKIIWRANQNDF